MAFAFGGLAVWAIRSLIRGKDQEIERLVIERDKFQKPFIDYWQSSKGGKKK